MSHGLPECDGSANGSRLKSASGGPNGTRTALDALAEHAAHYNRVCPNQGIGNRRIDLGRMGERRAPLLEKRDITLPRAAHWPEGIEEKT